MDWNFADIVGVGERRDPRPRRAVQGDARASRGASSTTAPRASRPRSPRPGLEPGSKVASYLYNCNEYTEGVYATFKMRGVPVNVNYRYLEDELVYLLDNSDAEALLFHGALGDRVAKVRDRGAEREALDPGRRRRRRTRTSRSQYEELLAAHEPMPRIERSGDDLYFLYTGGTTGMPKGVMWRNEDLFEVLGDGAYPLVGATPPDRRAETSGAIAKQHRRRGREPRAPARVAADARHRRVHVVPGAVPRRGDRHARRPALRPARAVADGAARARHADGDRRRRVRQADGARARGSRGEGHAVRPLVAAADHQLGRDVVGRGEAGADGSAATSSASTRSVRAKAWASPARSPRPAPSTRPRSSRSARARKVFTDDGARGRARLRRGRACSRSAATSRSATTRTRRSRTRRSATINGAALVGARRLRERRGRRHDHAARPRLGRHQLGRREDLPRRGRGSGEARTPRSPTASWSACPTNASAKRSPRSCRCARATRRVGRRARRPRSSRSRATSARATS